MFGRKKEITSKAHGRFIHDAGTRKNGWKSLSEWFNGQGHTVLYGFSHIRLINATTPAKGVEIEMIGTQNGVNPGVITEWDENKTTLGFDLGDKTRDPKKVHTSYRFEFKDAAEHGRKFAILDVELKLVREKMGDREFDRDLPHLASKVLESNAGRNGGFGELGYTTEKIEAVPV